MLKQFMFGAIAVCMAISFFAVTPVDAASATPNAKTQREAIFACKDAAGIGGKTRIETGFRGTFGGESNAWALILPHDQVDAVAAKQINDCAVRALGVAALGDTSSDAVSQRPATNYNGGEEYGSGARYRGASHGGIGCPPGSTACIAVTNIA